MRKRPLPTASSREYLAKIPGAYIVDAMDQLPPCGPESTGVQLMIDVPYSGNFRVTFKPLQQTLRGWGTRWFWIPSKAEPL